MSSIGLNIGLKSLLAARAGLEVVGHNVANANTPGYSRQSLRISASSALLLRGMSIGNGVDADYIRRTADELLSKHLVTQSGMLSALDTRLTQMAHVESLLGEGSDQGLNALMQSFFSSLSSLSSTPDDGVLRTGAVQASISLTDRFNELAQGLASSARNAALDVGAQTEEVNGLTAEIVKLNRQIASIEGAGVPANDLRDQRDEALKQLGGLIDITYSEASNRSVTVLTGGALLVGANKAYAMSSTVSADGHVTVRIQGNQNPIRPKGGTIGGLVQVSESFVPGMAEKLNSLAHQFIFEMNRAHSTGIPASGSFQRLTGSSSLRDQDLDGEVRDELLSAAGLSFPIQDGELYVTTRAPGSSTLSTVKIDIDPAETTVGDFLDAINAIPHMHASVDGLGRVQMDADSGWRFDFGRHLSPSPDTNGALGGARASLGAATSGPYALANGDTLDITGPGGAFTITFDGADFVNVAQATADEVASAINADPATTANGMRAVVVADRVVLQSTAEGSAETFTVDSGSSLGALGWSAGTSVSGHDDAVDIEISGSYSGDENTRFTFVPDIDGSIGTTPGLTIGVFGADGERVATLDVGAGYTPGQKLTVIDGVEVSFGTGILSASDHDVAELELLADSDTSDVLAALGLNALFTGTDASDIAVRADIARDPDWLAGSKNGAQGDNTILRELLASGQGDVSGLDDSSFGEFYGALVSDVGFEIGTAENLRQVDQLLFDSLTSRRDQVAGVNVDEELVNMVQFEQAFGAAAQYIQVIQATNDELMRMI